MTSKTSFLHGRPVLAAAVPTGLASIVVLAALLSCVGVPCVPMGLRYGVWLDQCPATDLRLRTQVNVENVARGVEGRVVVETAAMWLEGKGQDAVRAESRFQRGGRIDVTLRDDRGEVVPGLTLGAWKRGYNRFAPLTLPEVPDGDYTLRVTTEVAFDTLSVDVPLPLYAPALVHAISDRPLYKPGQTVLMRGVVLRRDSMAPLAARPGRWRVTDPSGTEMLVERVRTDDWGIVAASLPLDSQAEVGTWTARYESGTQSDTISFDVRPFQLPRLSAELTAAKPFFRVGDRVVVRGAVRYTSGAPVSGAAGTATVRRVEGRWPVPLAWERPFPVRTGPDGTFELDLGAVPTDLIERVSLRVAVEVNDASGERVGGAVSVVLAEDDLRVDTLTELGGGLVEGMNNRAYLRALTPDGRPHAGVKLSLVDAYDPDRPSFEAVTDEDGVAALQLDPGKPVTVVVRPAPERPRPIVRQTPSLSSGGHGADNQSLSLLDRRAIDAMMPSIADCGDFGGGEVLVGARVDASGRVTVAIPGADSAVGRCVARAVSAARMPATGELRTYRLSFSVPDSQRATFDVRTTVAAGAVGNAESSIQVALAAARKCLPANISSGLLGELHWRVSAGRTPVEGSFVPSSRGQAFAVACVQRAVSGLSLPAPAAADALGATSVSLRVPRAAGTTAPRATTKTGYAFRAVATREGEPVGETRVVFDAGEVPTLRLRATPTLVSAGDTVSIDLLRGPGYSGSLPDELQLMAGSVVKARAKLDRDTRSAKLVVPADARGFLHVAHDGRRAVIFVRDPEPLSVAITSDKADYRPGETAKIQVQTRAGERATSAAVGLIGVDNMLGKLAPLTNPDDFGRVTVRVTGEAAFGSFDPRALALGQIRGDQAARAALLRVADLPMDAAGDVRQSFGGQAEPPAYDLLASAFERVLQRALTKVGAWEATAPAGEVFTHAKMAAVWTDALAALAKEGTPARDAYGRTLTLDLLTPELLVLTDPRYLVYDKTRLPEDVDDWYQYVQREVAR